MLNMVRNTIMLRRALPFLVDGTLDAFAYNDDVLCYRRRGSDGQVASVLINHSLSDARSVRVPIEGDFALDLALGHRSQARGRWLRGGTSMATRIGRGVFQ